MVVLADGPSHKRDRCWEPKRKYSILDKQTYFILDVDNRTRVPYNIISYYENNVLKSVKWVDPIDNKIFIRKVGNVISFYHFCNPNINQE